MISDDSQTPGQEVHAPVSSRFEQARIRLNLSNLDLEFQWLNTVMASRMEALINHGASRPVSSFQSPPLANGPYRDFMESMGFGITERLTLILALSAALIPGSLDVLQTGNPKTKRRFPQVGGFIDRSTGEFLPTVQTAIFLLSGTNLGDTGYYQSQLTGKHRLFKEQVIRTSSASDSKAAFLRQPIEMDPSWFQHFLSGAPPILDAEADFPAFQLQTEKTFEDLVLPDRVRYQLEPAMNFVRHRNTLFGESDAGKKLGNGYVLMLYGPPGTGKTLTASVMGKHLGVDVYAINLSRVVSKYIGETEKNLERVFDRLENKNCILFFDEADALFGKRTEVTESKDRYANQEVAYLLQKIEKCSNLVVLATNFRKNLDDAFQRRILSFVRIDAPRQPERLQLWKNLLPTGFHYFNEDLPERLARDYQITGANIANVLKLACLEATNRQLQTLEFSLIEPFLRLEFIKENRIFEVREDRPEKKGKPYRAPANPSLPPTSARGNQDAQPRVANVYDAMSYLLDKTQIKDQQSDNDGRTDHT